MKTIKLFKLSFIFLLGVSLFLTGCSKDDNDDERQNQHKDAFADVFVKKVMSPQGDKYGLVFYSGGKGLTTCTAKAPNGTVYELKEFWKGPGNMRRHPENSDMQNSMPETGDYTFTLTFDDGQSLTLKDELTNVETPSIKSVNVEHVAGTERVSVNWQTVEGVNSYMVKLTDKDKNKKKPLFVNKTLTINDNAYTFDKTTTATPGWMQTGVPVAGYVCYVMVVGVKYEEGVTGAEKDQNKQMNTVKPTKIIW